MADKKNVFSTEVDRGSRAAGSVGDFFKQLNWQVVSFYFRGKNIFLVCHGVPLALC